MEYLWLFAVAMGPLILGGLLVMAVLRRRRLSRNEQARSDAATRRLYEEGAGDAGKRTPSPAFDGDRV